VGTYYSLANFTKREQVNFARISGMKAGEIVGNPQGAVIAAWYMLTHTDDDVAFVPDDRPFRGRAPYETDISSFTDVTDRVVEELVSAGDLIDYGTMQDETDPDVKFRLLRVRGAPPPPPGFL
jgi:hypothetical protein